MSDQNDMLRMLLDNNQRLKQTETREVPGNIPGFTSFYATGTWTPTLVGATIAGTFTYDATNTSGNYTRIGNQCMLIGRVRITAIAVAPTGALSIGGLPFTAITIGRNVAGVLSFGGWSGITITGARSMLAATILSATARATLFESGSNIAVNTTAGGGLVLVGGVADLWFTGSYLVA